MKVRVFNVKSVSYVGGSKIFSMKPCIILLFNNHSFSFNSCTSTVFLYIVWAITFTIRELKTIVSLHINSCIFHFNHIMPHGVHFLLFKCILVFVMPLVYGGLETNTKHNCDTKMGTKKSIYIISKRKAYKYSQIGTNQKWVDSVETSWDKLRTRTQGSGMNETEENFVHI